MNIPSPRPNFGFSIVMRKGKVRNDDQYPLYFRISLNSQRVEIVSKLFVKITEWDTLRKKVKGNSARARQINEALADAETHIRITYTRLFGSEKVLTIDRLKDAILGVDPRRNTFLAEYTKHMDLQAGRIGKDYSINSWRVNLTTQNHLESYIRKILDKPDIYISELDFSFIEGFNAYLIGKAGHCVNNAAKHIQRIRAVVALFIKRGMIDKDPFVAYKAKRQVVEATYLTAEEIRLIEAKVFDIERLTQVRDTFIFSCYTGLAYIDLQQLCSDDIQTGPDGKLWIVKHRQKTGVRSDIPLLPPALAILERYKNNLGCLRAKKLLPTASNQKLNAYLKEIADVCGIRKNVTMHVARHTFATTITMSNHVSIESVSKMLGHTNIKTTQGYAKVLKTKIASETNHLHALYAAKEV